MTSLKSLIQEKKQPATHDSSLVAFLNLISAPDLLASLNKFFDIPPEPFGDFD